MQKRISAADPTPIRVTIVTMDSNLAGSAARAETLLRRELPGLVLTVHAADEFASDDDKLAQCLADIARADICVAAMLFLEDHIRLVMPALQARRENCDAFVACLSAGEVVKLTRIGKFNMSSEALGAIAWLKRLRGKSKPGESSGKGQMAMLRRLPKLLRFVPGTEAMSSLTAATWERSRREKRMPTTPVTTMMTVELSGLFGTQDSCSVGTPARTVSMFMISGSRKPRESGIVAKARANQGVAMPRQ